MKYFSMEHTWFFGVAREGGAWRGLPFTLVIVLYEMVSLCAVSSGFQSLKTECNIHTDD